jgi:tripartite-type tricarboxylate transporter receptor subunit TctC
MATQIRRIAAAAAAIAAASASAPAWAADYPAKPITIVAASGPGGAVDTFSRLIGRQMEKEWRQPVVIVNKAGAGGAVAAAQVKNEAPDGYTLIVSNGNTFFSTWQTTDSATYTVDDFTYINSISGGGCGWIVKTDSPFKSYKDVVAAAKTGKSISFGAFSNDNKLVLSYVAKQDGVAYKMVSYKGITEILTAVLGGHVDFGFSGGSHAQHVKKGTMRVIVATDDKRLADSPNAPTLKELGYDVSECAYFAVAAPKGVPAAIVKQLEAVVARAMDSEEMKKYLEAREAGPLLLGADGVTKRMKEEAEVFRAKLKQFQSALQ